MELTATRGFTFSGFDGDGSIRYSDFNIYVGETFTLAFGPSCANDMIYETVTAPVHEPATLLLLGSGLIGLAGFRKKLKRHSRTQGLDTNNSLEMAHRFRADLVDLIEQDHKRSCTTSRILRLRRRQIWAEDGMRKCEVIFS